MDLSALILAFAAPVFVVAIGVEAWLSRRRRLGVYQWRDSGVNLATALINQLVALPWVLVEIAVLGWLHQLVPWHLSGWVGWVVAMIAVDFAYYWYHRSHHEVRVLWAIHVVHHSSEKYNLSVALRQPWVVFTSLPFLVPVALTGVAPRLVLASYAINLGYQFFIHTQLVDRLWAPIEFVFNTPSHHRVHHGSQPRYLDRNYGGILIVWDRLFGTFAPEVERVRYGLTKNLGTHRLDRVETHEFLAIWRDVRGARRRRDRFGHALRGPGWRPVSAVPVGAA